MTSEQISLHKKEHSLSLPEKVLLFVRSIFPLISINDYFFGYEADLYKNSVLNLFLYFAIVSLIYKSYTISAKYLFVKTFISSIFISIVLVFGNSVYKKNDLSLVFGSFNNISSSIFMLIGFCIFLYYAIKLALVYLCKTNISLPTHNEWRFFGANKLSWFLNWFVIFICWLPSFLSYYPGIYSYDIHGQTLQALGLNEFDRFQTTAHTLFFKICIDIGKIFGGPNERLATYSIIQMLILSFVFSFAIWYMAKKKIHFVFRIITLVWFALNPMNAIFSFTPTKDIMFAAFFILTTLMLIELVKNSDVFFRSLWRQAMLVLLSVLCCLFRINAYLAFVPVFVFLIIIYSKHFIKTAIIFLAFSLSFLIIYGPIYSALGVKGGDMREAMSVPAQQIANVVVNHEDSLTKADKDSIADIIDYTIINSNYNPRFADPIKNTINGEKFSSNPSKYINLYFSLMTRHPDDYINAFLSLNLPYWYPDAVFPDEFSYRMYIETYILDVDEFKITRTSIIPAILPFYEKFASGTLMQKIPVLALMFSISFPIWFLLAGVLIFCAKKKKKFILILLPGILLWATFMLGPVSNLRYIYAIIVTYPIYISLILCENSNILLESNFVKNSKKKTETKNGDKKQRQKAKTKEKNYEIG